MILHTVVEVGSPTGREICTTLTPETAILVRELMQAFSPYDYVVETKGGNCEGPDLI